MKTITVSEAQQRLPEIIRLVAQGEEFELVSQQRSVAKLVPAADAASRIDWCEAWNKSEAALREGTGSRQTR